MITCLAPHFSFLSPHVAKIDKVGHNDLYQCCPTLSPFATCGDRSFKCGDRQVFRSESLMINTLHFPQFFTKVATTRHLSPQLWRMWRQREYGWTPLIYTMLSFLESVKHSAVELLVAEFFVVQTSQKKRDISLQMINQHEKKHNRRDCFCTTLLLCCCCVVVDVVVVNT